MADYWLEFTNFEADPLAVARSKTGPGDVRPERIVLPQRRYACTYLLPLASRKRWLATFVELLCKRAVF